MLKNDEKRVGKRRRGKKIGVGIEDESMLSAKTTTTIVKITEEKNKFVEKAHLLIHKVLCEWKVYGSSQSRSVDAK